MVSSEYTFAELAQSWMSGKVKPADQYQTSGMSGWQPLSTLAKDLEAYALANPPRRDTAGGRASAMAKKPATAASDITYHFSRDGREYARYKLSELRASWPADILATDQCWHPGQSEWRSAWQLRNDLMSSAVPGGAANGSRRRLTPRPQHPPTRQRANAARGTQGASDGSFLGAMLSVIGWTLLLVITLGLSSRHSSSSYTTYDD